MMPRWSRTLANIYRVGRQTKSDMASDLFVFPCRRISRIAAVEVPVASDASEKNYTAKSEVNLSKMFRSKPCSLALPPESPLRIEEPNYEGIRQFLLKLMLFYSKQSTSIRAANVIYRRVVSQADKPAIYDVFSLEKTFRTTFCMLVLHMWLCLRRLKAEGKEGVELGQYVYEIYNHDLEMRVSKAGVNLLLSKWMRELEKVFYGNIVAFDTAMLPEAKPDELQKAIWKNVFFSEDGPSKLDPAALPAVLAFTRYVRRECTCLSLTDKEAMFSGNFMFTPLTNPKT
ncbi:ubiquinol-cytochrome-c reductase complex assembly factor 1-like [Cynara cardunculus var. scolymus]|uniref:ubiquinol-cytochrome-c reductase complex assembly factor 1-like n=1 Tax=Cynara cardunculus var. scolymus TaxID=59895 RepID=UPI000D623FFE|nr:ubiquinol-cytochrome-c reductase complex assembly factor 1-like [Cynara cardunculus var. scolymus]XP_024989736.1 ubiquinol-cytochrome-c reductase complex assembly factor 1-like [Cynara cardunculus var. scolymus]